MLARSYYQMNDFSRTEIVAKFFFSKHPESSYLDDMHQLLGNSFYKQRNYEAAIDEWVWVMGNSKDPRLKQVTGDYIFDTMNSFFTISQIEQIRVKHQNPFLDGVAQVAIGRKLLVAGENSRAKSVLSGFLQSQPDHAYAGKARELLGAPVSGSSSGSRTFLYLQDTDANTKDVSEALALGMQYALDEFLKQEENYLSLGNFYQEKRDYFLNGIKGSRFQLKPSQGTYFQLLNYSKISNEKDTEFAIRLTKENKIASIPVSVFYNNENDEKVLRFCFAKKKETLDKAIEIINAI